MALKIAGGGNPDAGGGSRAAKEAAGKIIAQTNAMIIALTELNRTAHVLENSVPNKLRGEAAVVTNYLNTSIGQLRKALHEAGSVNLKIPHGN